MNTKISLVACLLLVGTGAGFLLTHSTVAAESAQGAASGSVPLPRITETATSPDGREAFEVSIFEPWTGAGRRVILMSSASISSSGFAKMSTLKTSESTSAHQEEVSLVGSNYSCTAVLNVSTWAGVHSKGDVTLVVQPKQ